MRRASLLFFLFIAAAAYAQPRPKWTQYKWDDDPKLHPLSVDEQKKAAVIIKDKRIIEVSFEGDGNNQQVWTYYTKHVIIRLNADAAIEEYNKVYIPMTNVVNVVDLHARVILPNGKVIDLDKSSVKDVENYENNGPYKIFALEGVENGCEVEYIYTVQKPFRMYGTETYRSNYDYRQISLDIIAPHHLRFDAKSYNGLPNPKKDEDVVDKNVLKLRVDSVRGFENEVYSAGDGAYPRVEYKLAYNLAASEDKRLYTWNDAADAYYKAVNDISSTELRQCQDLYKQMKIDPGMEASLKIAKIESWLKANFTCRADAEGDKYEKITGILQTKLASQFGIMRLYNAVFLAAGIKVEIVLTTDRFSKTFDGDFDSWTYLEHFLLYFPDTKGYVAPTEQFCRYNFIPPNWTGQDGLFIRQSLSDPGKGIGAIKNIKTTDWTQNMSDLFANVTFDLDKGTTNLHMKMTYLGNEASFIQPYYSYLGTEDRDKDMKDLLKNMAADARPENLAVSGYNSDDTLYHQPFVVQADFSTNSFLESTCGKIIFKVGEVIGLQEEMYQATQRRTDMDLPFPHGYHREITFTVPDGYRVTNLDALNMDVTYKQDSTLTLEFKSHYTQDGNVVKVFVDEDYRLTHYSKDIYEDFRKVINASADFNKIVVYFEKVK